MTNWTSEPPTEPGTYRVRRHGTATYAHLFSYGMWRNEWGQSATLGTMLAAGYEFDPVPLLDAEGQRVPDPEVVEILEALASAWDPYSSDEYNANRLGDLGDNARTYLNRINKEKA